MSGLFLTIPNVYAETYISGTIDEDTTWNLAGSPYYLNYNVTISSGVTLTIDPGVEVQADDGPQIRGTLNAAG